MSLKGLNSDQMINSPTKSEAKANITSPQVRKSMVSIGSPRSPPINDSHLYENDFTSRPYLPECWTDTKRMNALMAPFRAREANPEGWDLKINFWINCITKWSLQTHSVVFTVEDIVKAFERGSKLPDVRCIQLVMSQLKRNKSVVFSDEFNENNLNKNWINWGLNTLVLKPFSIGWSLVSGSKNTNTCSEEILREITTETKFVMCQTLQVMSEEMNKYLNHLEDIDCIRFDLLHNKCKNHLNITFDTFEVIVNNLEIENKLKTFVDNGIKIIKIGKNANIRESDIGLIRLETAKELLENEIEKLENEIDSIRNEAKVCVQNKNREKAILLLKRKKRVEIKLNKKVTQLDNVDLLIDQLINSSSHNIILQAFQRANDALKLANSNQEDIESTMSDVEETLDVVSEIVSDVSRPLVTGDTDDIEDELDDLLNELNDQKTAKEESNRTHVKQRLPNEEQLEQISKLSDLSINDDSLTEVRNSEKLVTNLEFA